MNETSDPRPTADDPDSIYRAPASNTDVAPDDDLLAAFVGPKNADYYLPKFERFESGSNAATWHWPAFFISSLWLLYRKMWGWAFLYWIALPTGLTAITALIMALFPDPETGAAFGNAVYYGAYVLIAFVALPMYANRLYYNHAQKKIQKIRENVPAPREQALEAARVGGTSSILIILIPVTIFVIGILAAIAIPAYQDYTIRAQVGEGVSLSAGAKAAVTDYYLDNGSLPADNDEAGIPPPTAISGSYVVSVTVDDGMIDVIYGNDAHPFVTGKRLRLLPRPVDGAVDWACQSPIAPQHLPATCR